MPDTVGSTAPVGGFGIGDINAIPTDLLQVLYPYMTFGPTMAGDLASQQAAANLATQQANQQSALQIAQLASSTGLRDALAARNWVRGMAPQPGFGSAFAGTAPYSPLVAPDLGSIFSGFNQQMGDLFGGGGASQAAPSPQLFRTANDPTVYMLMNGQLRSLGSYENYIDLFGGKSYADLGGQVLQNPIESLGYTIGAPITLAEGRQFLNPSLYPESTAMTSASAPIDPAAAYKRQIMAESARRAASAAGAWQPTGTNPAVQMPGGAAPVPMARGGTVSQSQMQGSGILVGEEAPEVLRLNANGDIEVIPIVAQAQRGITVAPEGGAFRPTGTNPAAPMPTSFDYSSLDPMRTFSPLPTGGAIDTRPMAARGPLPTAPTLWGGNGASIAPRTDTMPTLWGGNGWSMPTPWFTPDATDPIGFRAPAPAATVAPQPIDIPAAQFLQGVAPQPFGGPRTFDLPEYGMFGLKGPASAAALFRPGILTGQEQQDIFDLFGIGGIPPSVAQFLINQATPGHRFNQRRVLGF